MEKVYLLLRNNRQIGPLTIGELRQQNLQPSDLIWIEGESSAWCYPSELEALHQNKAPYSGFRSHSVVAPAPATVVPRPVASGKKPAPADEIELQAEALRKRALSYAPFKPGQYQKNASSREEGPVFYRTGDDRIDIVFHKREKSYAPAQLLAAAVITTLAVMVWNNRESLIPIRKAVESVAAKAATFETFIKQPEQQPATETVAIGRQQNEKQQVAAVAPVAEIPAFAAKPAVKKQPTNVVASAAPPIQNEPGIIQPAREEALATPEPVSAVTPREPDVIVMNQESEKPGTTLAEPEKKKTIGQAIKGLFKKKKRDEDRTPANAGQEG